MTKGTPIRSVSRAVKVLQTVNRLRNPTLMEVSRATNLPYPTVFRLMQTLLFEGLVESEPNRKRYVVTSLTQTLSHGFQDEDRLARIAREPIRRLTQDHGWPVSLTVRVGNRMMVKESTHLQSSMTLTNYYPGFSLPLLECASGKAFLAFSPDDEVAVVLTGLRELYTAGHEDSLTVVDADYLRQIRHQGYAVHSRNQHTQNPGKTSSLAVPVLAGDRVLASLVLTFFASGLSVGEAAERYLGALQETAAHIASAFAADTG